jgi:tRNA threonylcarbamoyladenosine biosynthesis protein TsaE
MARAAEERVELELVDAEATEAFGARLGQALVAGSCLALVGELGAGKTTLVRGLGRGLGCGEAIVSPTFTRMRALEGRLALYHFDAWRAGGEGLFEEGREFFSGSGVAVVEWADRVEAWLPRPRLELTLTHRPGGRRLVVGRVFRAPAGAGPAARGLEQALRAALDSAVSG